MGPGIAIYRSRNRFTAASGGTITLTSPAAASTPLTINAHASQSGPLINIFDSAGVDRWVLNSNYGVRHQAGSTDVTLTGLSGAYYVRGSVNDATTCRMYVENTLDDTLAVASYTIAAFGCTGGLIAYPANYASAGLRDYTGLFANTDSAGTVFFLGATTQQWRFNANGGNVLIITGASPSVWTLQDATNFSLGTSTGFKLGTAGTQKIGVWGNTPVVRPSAYTPTNVTTDRSFDADTVVVAELADVVGTLIADLQSIGWLA